MNGLKKTFFEKSTPYETVTKAMKSTQNLSPGRFWHAEAESEVKNLQIFHPDLEMKENDLQKKIEMQTLISYLNFSY